MYWYSSSPWNFIFEMTLMPTSRLSALRVARCTAPKAPLPSSLPILYFFSIAAADGESMPVLACAAMRAICACLSTSADFCGGGGAAAAVTFLAGATALADSTSETTGCDEAQPIVARPAGPVSDEDAKGVERRGPETRGDLPRVVPKGKLAT